MAPFALIGVLRGFPAAAYRHTPRRKPLFGVDQNKNFSFLNWIPILFIYHEKRSSKSDQNSKSEPFTSLFFCIAVLFNVIDNNRTCLWN